MMNSHIGTAIANKRDNMMSTQQQTYEKIDLKDIDGVNILGSHHALFGAIWGKGLVERYDVYRNKNFAVQRQKIGASSSPSSECELLLLHIKIGDGLNGHENVVHGGIVSLLLDESIGWGYEYLQWLSTGENKIPALTANLNVNFRAPLLQESEFIIRVHHVKTEGKKIYLDAVMQCVDGSSTVIAEASSLFIQSPKNKMLSKL